jgi:glycosyl transferase family 61
MRSRWHVTIRHGPGTPEHFHHFLLGHFVPLVYHLSTDWKHARFDRLIVRSCGPLDRIMSELGEPRIEIIGRDQHLKMAQLADADGVKFVTIQGCDYPATFDRATFSRVSDVLMSMSATQVASRRLAARWPSDRGSRILLIQRGPSHPYYHSDRAEGKPSSGQDRRSIANHDELYRALRLEYPGCLSATAESLSLSDQIALFSLADVIIAQHGAALANLIWARSNATVIEIFPQTATVRQKANDMFRFLALCNGLRYRKLLQPNDHSPICIDAVRNLVATVLTSRPGSAGIVLRRRAFRLVRPALPIRHGLYSLYEPSS